MKYLSYTEFSEIVPQETKEFVDKFLNLINIKSYEELKSSVLYDNYIFLSYIYDYAEPINKGILLNNAYDNDIIDKPFYNNIETTSNTIEVFQHFSKLFCIFNNIYDYYTLTPNELIAKNIQEIRRQVDGESSSSSIYKLYNDIFPNGSQKILNTYKQMAAESKAEITNKLKSEIFKNLSIDAISYLETVAKTHEEYGSNNSDSSIEDIVSYTLFTSLYTNKNAESIIKAINIDVNELPTEISPLSFSKLKNKTYKIGVLKRHYSKFISDGGKITIVDIIKKFMDRTICNNYLVETNLNKIGKSFDIFNNLEEKIVEYQKNKDEIEKNKMLSYIYTSLPLNISNYIEYISKIYDTLDKNKSKLKIELTTSNIVNLSIFVSIMYKNNEYASYFINHGITLEKILKYLQIDKIEFDKLTTNSTTIKLIYDDLIYNIVNELNKNNDIEIIMSKSLERNDKILKKVLTDIDDYFIDKNDIKRDLNEYIKIKKKNNQIKISKKFYGDLDIEVIRYIETSYLLYKQLKQNVKDKYTNDDIVELSLILTLFSNKSEYQESKKYGYFNSELLKINLFNKFNVSGISLLKEVFTDEIDIQEVSKLYGKYIFGGKNKNKKRKEIEVDDIFKNLFNKEINNSYMLKILLNENDLSYEKIQNIDNLYFEYRKKQLLKQKGSDTNFELVNNIDKIYRTICNSTVLSTSLQTTFISTLIYLYYYDNNKVKYLLNRGVTLEKILEYIKMPKEQVDKFKELDTDFSHILNKLSSYVFEKNIEAVIEELIGNSSKYNYGALKKPVFDFMGVSHEKLDYELLHNEKYEEKIKRICLETIQKSGGNFELINDIDKIYRTIINSSKIEHTCNGFTITLSAYIHLFYNKNKYVKYFIDRGITLDKILEYLDMPKEQLDKYVKLETDYRSVLDGEHISYYLSAKSIDEMIKKIAENYGTTWYKNSMRLSDSLSKFVGTSIKELNYEIINEEKYEEKIKRDCLETIQANGGNFELINDIDKIYRTIANSNELENFFDTVLISSFIYLFYVDNNRVKYLLNRGISLEKIAEHIKISKEKIDEYSKLSTDYRSIYDIFELSTKYPTGMSAILISSNCIDEVIRKIMEYNEDKINIIKKLYEENKVNVSEIEYELLNNCKYIPPLTREQKLEKYTNMSIPKLEIDNIETIPEFGKPLSEQAETISKEFSYFIENSSDDEVGEQLQESIEAISKEKPKLFNFGKNKKTSSEILKDKKQLLDDLNNYLETKSNELKSGIQELQYIRKAIAIYLVKAKEYLNQLNDAEVQFSQEIMSRNYVENDFRVFDDNLKQQLLTDKKASINSSIIQMLQQYQKVTMQMSTHATILNQVQLARETTVQNLYIQLALNEGNKKERDSINSLTNLMKLLNGLTTANQNNMLDNIEKINQLSKSNYNVTINEKDKLIMEHIIEEQHLLPPVDENKIKEKK